MNMTLDKATCDAIQLSKVHKTDAVVYREGFNSYDAILLSQYFDDDELIICTYENGVRID
jgi:hypothetical protein